MIRRSLRRRFVAAFITLLVVVLGVGFVAVRLLTPTFYRLGVQARVGATSPGRGGPPLATTGAAGALDAAYADALTNAMIVVAVVGVLVSLVLTLILSRRLLSTLDEVATAAERMAHGNYRSRVPEPPESELAAVAAAVNSLGAALAETETRRAQLISDLAHELRNPLTTIEGYMEALIDGVLPGVDETYTAVADEAHRLKRLTEDLSFLSRAQEGAVELNPSLVDVSDTVAGTVERLRPQFDAKHVALDLHGRAGLHAWVDRSRLVQALTNVTGNALSHTPEGGTVSVACRAESTTVVVSVKDTGAGIPAEHLETVFERYTRLDPNGEGTGIGLNIARSLLRMQGGDVVAHSEGPGRGTTIELVLPAYVG